MMKLCRVTKVKVFFLLLRVYVFNFDLFEFSAFILEKGLLLILLWEVLISFSVVLYLVSAYIYDV